VPCADGKTYTCDSREGITLVGDTYLCDNHKNWYHITLQNYQRH